ncbi:MULTISPECIES: TIGR00341 family protein [Haloferax]|uniref:TIGR00341 family protein n=1 Tax=Haloferax marinum TaxID=2666143 RepID=A0A6A8G945_9EURY|nr:MULTISPECIES: TIGR00341 family protein [Haloferax]KAB1198024.1 TIGR00341 family protein [Haloferax sp. CBA1150]MRW97092.1 TIGR00341 family protein [Haloferax marinum]
MRIVQVLIPNGTQKAVLAALDAEEIDYAVWEETGRGDFEAVVSFPIPESGVEPILEKLETAGIHEDAYTIVMATETVISRRLPKLEKRYKGLRISREELVARAEDLAPARSTYVAFLVLSTIIATAGLLLDSAATIIGAMVVAPLMGPAITASVGTVLGNNRLATRGVIFQVFGLALAIAVGAVMGWILKDTLLLPPELDIRTIPQVAERTSPTFLALVLALGSGIAGAISVMRNAGSALVGVAIAVALVPPAATAGLGIAWGYDYVAIAAGTLVLVNLLAINLSALIIFYLAGYRPVNDPEFDQRTIRRSVLKRLGVIVVGILLLSVVLGGVTVLEYVSNAVDRNLQTEAEAMLGEPEYEGLNYEETLTEFDYVRYITDGGYEMEILVGVEEGTTVPPDLAQRLDDRLTTATQYEELTVRVAFLDEQVSE